MKKEMTAEMAKELKTVMKIRDEDPR